MSSIPAYPLHDSEGRRCLSKNRRFNHIWYSSKKLDVYDNHTKSDYASGVTPQNGEFPINNVFFAPLHGAIQS